MPLVLTQRAPHIRILDAYTLVLKSVFIGAGRNIVSLALAQRAPFIRISDSRALGRHKIGVQRVERRCRERGRGRVAGWFRRVESSRAGAIGGDGEAAEAFNDDVFAVAKTVFLGV
jgi:hypothetical protein